MAHRVLLLAWAAAAAFSHPAFGVALIVLAAPIVVAWFAARMTALAATRGERDGGGRASAGRRGLRWRAVVLLAVLFVLHYYDVAARPISDHLNGGPALAKETFPQALLQGLLATSPRRTVADGAAALRCCSPSSRSSA